jgi:LysM repeat protein
MRARTVLILSLAANLVLVFAWLLSARKATQRTEAALALAGQNPSVQVKTNVVIRRQFFTWQEVESEDYRAYIKNLREIGCPEQTIRDIIIADVNALYARKRSLEVLSPAQQWWKTEPDPDVVRAAAAKIRALESERRALLASLLGQAWESGDLANLPRPTRRGVALDGPVLGILPDEVKRSVEQIVSSFHDQVETMRGQGRGDMADMARLNRQLRTALSRVLSPQQLEEFLLRYSATASSLRSELAQLKHFQVSPDEFRALFRATDHIEEEIQLIMGNTDQQSLDRLAVLEEQRDNAIRRTLNPERYAQYRMLQDADYRDATTTSQEAGSPALATTLYEINQAMGEELARIRANTNLTDRQRAIEERRAELNQLQATAVVLGEEIPPEPTTPRAPASAAHVIKAGETIYSVSAFYGISPEALSAANPTLNIHLLRAGDAVNIPSRLPAQAQSE